MNEMCTENLEAVTFNRVPRVSLLPQGGKKRGMTSAADLGTIAISPLLDYNQFDKNIKITSW